MTSIERSEIGCIRAEFNRPLACITVVPGETTLVFPTLDLKSKPSLVWFDYDSSIGGPVIQDLAILAANCQPNSIFIMTINAKLDELPKTDENDDPIDSEASLRRIAGDLVPTPLSRKRLQRPNYPKLLCEILDNQLQNATVSSGRNEWFVKLFDLVYSDGTPMVTVGGIIAAADDVDKIRQLVQNPGWEGIVPQPIAVPPLTVKEKLALDRMMPSPLPPTDARIDQSGIPVEARTDRYVPQASPLSHVWRNSIVGILDAVPRSALCREADQ